MPYRQKYFTSDWLNIHPVFYNTKTKKVSKNINDVIDKQDFSFDPEGFNNYLDYGFSVFGQTPIKNVKFLDPCQKIIISKTGIKITNLSDPVSKFSRKQTDIEQVVKILATSLQKWQKKNKKIILPLSGGFDSRLLLKLLDKSISDIFSFTYGLSPDQRRSIEVVNAQSEAVNKSISWHQIPLSQFHNYIDEWYQLIGLSTHLHGMY